jgi:P-type Cu2+ transporter
LVRRLGKEAIMQRAVLDVHGLLWVMEVDDVARTVRAFPGVQALALDAVHGKLVVRFDEHVTGLESLQRVVEECYYHCRGERSLGHLCANPATGETMPSSAQMLVPTTASVAKTGV